MFILEKMKVPNNNRKTCMGIVIIVNEAKQYII